MGVPSGGAVDMVEAREKRQDAQLAREMDICLPYKLTQNQRRELVLGFVQEQFVDRGMVADVAIHRASREGDQRNHHAHVMLTMRSISAEGFGNKVREWNEHDLLRTWREEWAKAANKALERAGHKERIDHRTLEAQYHDAIAEKQYARAVELARPAGQHLGPRRPPCCAATRSLKGLRRFVRPCRRPMRGIWKRARKPRNCSTS